ncbi:MAG: biotin--[acetyl-CoA-carboxylase] ligase [Acidimicrobiales bacterium]
MSELEGPIGRFVDIEWVDSTGSTNTDLANLVRDDATRPLSILIADEQVAGRGRRDRRWETPPRSAVLMSCHVRWPELASAHMVPTALGIAAVDAISAFDRRVLLKWPNDLVSVDGRKVAGMLTEVVASRPGPVDLVCGIGCNVSWPTDTSGFESGIGLDALGAEPVNRVELARAIVESFDACLDDASRLGGNAQRDRYRERSATIGQYVRAEQSAGTIEGLATDVDNEGRLIIDVGGRLITVDVGDVVHLRPAGGAGG